ncbi:MAG: hypothetical protein JNM72_23755 [Deltaproteobacteria bacterium]|nr:hypothetical protein [Deltaproteobacteria bacterium]
MSAVDLRARAMQLGLLVLLSALAGALVGMDRPLLGGLRALHIGQQVNTPALGFLAVLGLCTALSAYAAGRGADRWGRRPVLIAGG